MELKYSVKQFTELTTTELYEVLRLRNEVFVVEQKSIYLDLDNKDQKSLHLLYYADQQLAGYTRLLPAGVSYDVVSIGRVVISPLHRSIGLGKKLMEASIESCYEKFGETDICISAQYHLLKFYRSLGFIEEGHPYNEDGIPHIQMTKPFMLK